MADFKLTPETLRRIVREERARFMQEAKKKKNEVDGISSDADEVDADGFADTLANKTDHAKAVGIKNESRKLEKLVMLEQRLARLQRIVKESKKRSLRRINSSSR